MNGVCVVIPAFNAARTIGRCLESLAAQEAGCPEIIVVDDASTDGTAGVVRGFARAELVTFPVRRGAAAARNAGLARARRELVLFMDSDVALEPGTLGNLARGIGDRDVVFPRLDFEDGLSLPAPDGKNSIWAGAARDWPWCSACFLARREALARLAGPFDETYGIYYEDTDLFLRCFYAGLRAAFLPGPAANHLAPAHRPWTRDRLELEMRNTLYAMLKFFPRNTLNVVCRVVRPGMFWRYFSTARGGGACGLKDFWAGLARAAAWNLRHLPRTLRANLALGREIREARGKR